MEVTMRIGMLFPGYGSQFVGMGKELYDNSRIIQEYFEEASQCLGINFVKLCFASSDIELSKIVHAYPALFLVSVATAMLIKSTGIAIDYVAGYGLGEYSALCAAGGLSFPDGLYLLTKLSYFYTQIRDQLDVKSVMVDGLSAKKLNQLCKETSNVTCCAHISIYDRKKEHTVTGHSDAVNVIAEMASDAGADVIRKIESEEGFHTPLLNDLAQQLKVYLTKVDVKDLTIPFISSVNVREIYQAKKAQDVIIGHIVKPLYWYDVLKQLADSQLLIVLTPAKSMTMELRDYYPDKTIIGIDTMADLEALKELLAKIPDSLA
jgi:[acyl-carrier-protein] S-malonyltransferase